MRKAKRAKYTVSFVEPDARNIEITAKALNLTPAEYIRICVTERGRLLKENSELQARLRDCLKNTN